MRPGGPTAPDRAVTLLLAALVLYGLASSPAPNAPGLAEAAIAVCLALAVGPLGVVWAAGGAGLVAASTAAWRDAGSPWLVPASLALLYLALVPSGRSMLEGWQLRAMLRDIVPLAYFFLPLLLAPVLTLRLSAPDLNRAARVLAAGLVLAGLVFAARFLWITGAWAQGLDSRVPTDGLLYLGNDPSVTFAALLLSCAGLSCLARPSPARLALALLAAAGAALCLTVLAVTLQRAALAAWLVGTGLYALGLCARHGAALVLLPLAAAVGWWASAGLPWQVLGLLAEKTRLVGFNQHDAEIVAALRAVGAEPARALFGAGWGALLDSPAVPTQKVTYFHALPLYLLAKAGALGMLAGLAYVGAVVLAGLRALPACPAPVLAALAPLAVGTLIQPSFKYLTYGACLLLLTLLAAAQAGATESARQRR